MKPEYRQIACQTPLLSSVPDAEVDRILAEAHVTRFERGQLIFLQGETANAVYIVLEGWVKLYRIAANGAEAIVGVFTRGRSFGEAVAFRKDVYPVSSEAVTPCTLLRVEAESYLRGMRNSPETATAMLSATFAHLHSLVSQLESMKARTGAQRVAEFLCELAPCDTGACELTLPYDKTLIAGRLGMKPESLSRAFARLKPEGVTIQQNKAQIADLKRLRDYIEDDPGSVGAR